MRLFHGDGGLVLISATKDIFFLSDVLNFTDIVRYIGFIESKIRSVAPEYSIQVGIISAACPDTARAEIPMEKYILSRRSPKRTEKRAIDIR